LTLPFLSVCGKAEHQVGIKIPHFSSVDNPLAFLVSVSFAVIDMLDNTAHPEVDRSAEKVLERNLLENHI